MTGAANACTAQPAFEESAPDPALVRREFDRRYAQDPESAVRYLYDMGVETGYVRLSDIARNVCWVGESAYGPLEITINLSKPEKDPRAIAAAARAPRDEHATATDENPSGLPAPQCDICWENEGWPGGAARPAKPNLRIAAIELAGEPWGLQYSPYGYFDEHCIALSRTHRPMKIDGACFERLLDFVDLFPLYFIGSNADLPIVGGSILSHDHFQGGRHRFPMMDAPLQQGVHMAEFPEVECAVVKWPASTLRLTSRNRVQLAQMAVRVWETWLGFDDEACGVVHATGKTPHNTLNPIVHREGDAYVLHLVLRNNRTSEERPWGLFHPDVHLHHIKKENIGLIEIMGRAILPPRLVRELPGVEDAEAGASIRAEVTRVFAEVLEATGVFKDDAAGQRAWTRFIEQMGGQQQ